VAIEPPNELVDLEKAAWAEVQEGRLTVETATAVQAAITEYAAEHGLSRNELEQAVKTAARHPEPPADA
jgi:hypothetical protein